MAAPGPPLLAARAALSTGDFIMRLMYFMCAPVVLHAVALLFSITGILINVGLAITVFFFANRVRRFPLLTKVLRRGLAFEAYYREHPPKPFLYYVFFPLLFPYWLVNASARREISNYKGFTGVPLVVLLGLTIYNYVAKWRPEVAPVPFLIFSLATLAMQIFILMILLMPLSTTVVAYHLEGKRRRLVLLLAACGLSCAMCVAVQIQRPPIVQSVEVQLRAKLRTAAAPTKARSVLEDASQAALEEIEVDGKIPDMYHDIWIEGPAADAAREKLAALYKSDECDAFRLSVVRTKENHEALLLFLARSGDLSPDVWIAISSRGVKLKDDAIPERERLNAQLGQKPRTIPKKKPPNHAPSADGAASARGRSP